MDDALREALISAELFRGVEPETLEQLVQQPRIRTMASGDVLIESGDARQELHVVLRGRLSVHLEGPSAPAVAIIDAGSSVGELGIIDGKPASACVVASEATDLLDLDEEDFWDLIAGSRAFARNLLQGLSARLRANNRVVSTESRQRRKAEHAAHNDGLCEVYNRAWLDQELPRLCASAHGEGEALAVAVVDIDYFKRFNDQHGHQAGDRVLKAVATTLRDHLRKGDVIARYGGEEFVMVLHDAPAEAAEKAGDRLRKTVERLQLEGLPPVTISVGVATIESGDTPQSLIARGDQALYEAKRSGRNRVCLAAEAIAA